MEMSFRGLLCVWEAKPDQSDGANAGLTVRTMTSAAFTKA